MATVFTVHVFHTPSPNPFKDLDQKNMLKLKYIEKFIKTKSFPSALCLCNNRNLLNPDLQRKAPGGTATLTLRNKRSSS